MTPQTIVITITIAASSPAAVETHTITRLNVPAWHVCQPGDVPAFVSRQRGLPDEWVMLPRCE